MIGKSSLTLEPFGGIGVVGPALNITGNIPNGNTVVVTVEQLVGNTRMIGRLVVPVTENAFRRNM